MKYIETTNITQSVRKILDETFQLLYHAIIIDKHGIVVYINENYQKFLNIKKSDALGKHVEEIIPGTKLYETLENGVEVIDDVFEFEDGRSLIYSRLPIKNEYNETVGVVSISSINSAEKINSLYGEINKLKSTNKLIQQQLKGLSPAPTLFDKIVGTSQKINEIKSILAHVSNSNMPILLTGESGCGKEVFATAIHNASARKNAPFVKVNCAAIPRELMESELFGYETGTFSGAVKGGRPGKFELANGGSILLDEIEELPLNMQSKLLRVLQEYEVERIGSIKPISLNLQIICCSNKDLYKMVEEKLFRDDLLYRINVMEIEIPPLRERIEDIPLLCDSIIESINKKYKLNVAGITDKAIKYLSEYYWPGNVRELQHVLERACAISKANWLDLENFTFIEKKKKLMSKKPEIIADDGFSAEKQRLEAQLIKSALEKAGQNKSLAAKNLGISRSLLYDKIRKYQI